MTLFEKKARERSVLDFYLKLIGLNGEIHSRERPDFIVVAGTKRIGVEITEYHQPRYAGEKFPRKVVEMEWSRLQATVAEYRKTTRDLDNLGVYLSFVGFDVPPEKQHQDFIRAVHDEIKQVKDHLSQKRTKIRITNKHPIVLGKYLRVIDVREVGCYMEWDWNHMVAGVGTSEDELLGILVTKLALKREEGINELHLVIAGDGPSGATYIGFLSPEWLTGWAAVNAALDASDYNVVAILNYDETCIWRRNRGWTSIKHV